jgi:hypothetical protein
MLLLGMTRSYTSSIKNELVRYRILISALAIPMKTSPPLHFLNALDGSLTSAAEF